MIFFSKRNLVPAVFLHIQKTAGTSLVRLVRRYYRWGLIKHGDYLKRSNEELMKSSFVSGHFGYDLARPLIQSRYSFTFLRDPVERLLSFYFYCRNENARAYPIYRMAHELDLENFLRQGFESPLIRPYLYNQQAWALACGWGNKDNLGFDNIPEPKILGDAIHHLSEFSHVGFTESYDQDVDIIFSALNLPQPQKKKITNSTKNRPSKQDISKTALNLAKELTRLDQELYATAWAERWADQQPPQ